MDAGALPSAGNLDIKDENTTRSSYKKCFRLLKMSILVCCVAGFSLQTAEFLNDFYKYPVVVSLEYEGIEEFPVPAFTLCSKYWYDFKYYCQKFPDKCETTEYPENFCEYHPQSCKRNATHGIVPTSFPPHYLSDRFLKIFAYNSSIFTVKGDYPTIITGPFFTVTDGVHECCFTSNNGFGINGLRKAKGSLLQDQISWFFHYFHRNSLQSEFFFTPEAAPYGTLYVHSPLHAFKKDDKSLIFKGGKSYVMSIRLSMKGLLPHPFESDCRDYELSWKRNNNTGPVSREMCEFECAEEDSSYFEKEYAVWSNKRLCTYLGEDSVRAEELEHWRMIAEKLKEDCECIVSCKRDCWTHSYDFSVTENDETPRLFYEK
ncbi:hypothetical protein JTE90_026022 [Oedothorax gibbosus]|uniref:Amiloride-sensitive sodium channel n=1 Tax=Oedothorax gibbosus TaxID=931172 RepID=A0AAV6TTF0_9ARAC|nr:hypothetical protein JTE90_026022 [Oedothorax gibbosus]